MTTLEQKIWDLALPICEKNNVELVEVNFKKQRGENILEIIIDNESGITMDDAVNVNQELSDLLDVVDPIDTSYCLEVSSPGCERELKNENDLKKSIGKYINVKTYAKILIDKYEVKEFEGDLLDFDENTLTVDVVVKTKKKQIIIERNKIAKVRLAVKF
ncbi:MAG: ribosome maturation factor RimP [Bacilli bacterium]|nr:ribosome maturation factor RimP [Bacilli bacterium]